MLKLIVAYKYAAHQSISSASLQCQLAELSNCCHSEIAFVGLSVITAPDVPADLSQLVPVRTMQCQWCFQAPTGKLMTRLVYVIPVLVAVHEQPEAILAHLTNLPISSNAPTKPRLSITMSQALQTTITDAAFRHHANAGDHANALKVDPQLTRPIAIPGLSTSTATATPSVSGASSDYPDMDRPDTNKDKPPGKGAKHFTGVCANCGATAIVHRCLGCRLVFYCMQRCQALQWAQHKFFCQCIHFTHGFGNP